MADSETILVTGATGNTGSALLHKLKASGAALRAMIRNADGAARFNEGVVTAVIANFDDGESLQRALDGVTRAYLVTPSGPAAGDQQVRFAELAAAAGVKQLVKLSQLAADEESPVRFLRYHAAVERRIRELGIDFTFLRPNLFFQELLSFAPMIAKEGRFFAPIGSGRVSAVDVRDISAVAAVALTERGHEGKTYTITGPQALTHDEIALAIGEAIGRPVTFMEVPPAMFAEALRGAGLPAWQVEGLVEDYAYYERDEAAGISSSVRDVTGVEARDVRSFARDYAMAFSGGPSSAVH